MPRILLIAALPLALGLPLVMGTAKALAQPDGAISPQTTNFIIKAAATDAFERDAGRLAEKRSANADVRAFGGMMVTAHTTTTDKLRDVLVKDHLPVPQMPTPSPDQAKMLADLSGAPKKGFDKAYAHSQVVAHQMALMVIQDYAMNGDNRDLKKLAADTAPLVQKHLDMALKLEGQLGGPPKSLTRKED
jgi:putative membrane protein